MTRRRFVQSPEPPYELIEVTEGYVAPLRTHYDGVLWNDRDYENLPPENGEAINTRTKHREYMRRHGLTTADDFTEHWKRSEQQRNEYRTTGKGGAVTREDVARAIHDLTTTRR